MTEGNRGRRTVDGEASRPEVGRGSLWLCERKGFPGLGTAGTKDSAGRGWYVFLEQQRAFGRSQQRGDRLDVKKPFCWMRVAYGAGSWEGERPVR